MMLKYIVLFAFPLCFGQEHKDLMYYSGFYNKNIDEFMTFMNVKPAALDSSNGLRQIVYEFEDYNVGIEEHPSGNDRIGEIYIFQTEHNENRAATRWKKIFEAMNADESVVYMRGIFQDDSKKQNFLTPSELISHLDAASDPANVSYGAIYKGDEAYYSLFAVKGKLVFTVNGKIRN
jgi:hypothetical protein